MYRTEHDSLGAAEVPAAASYGAQRARRVQSFPIGHARMPPPPIGAYAQVNKAFPLANQALAVLVARRWQLIAQACDDVLAVRLDGEFTLVIFQTSSGTHTNMNLNEVNA